MASSSGSGRPFIGRPESVDALRRRGDAVRFGRGGLTVVEGEAGVGKSTLIEGLLREVRAQGVQVLLTRARSLENPPPLLLLREALASRTADPPESSPLDGPGGAPIAFAPSHVSAALEAGRYLGAAPGTDPWLPEDRLLEPFGGATEAIGDSRHRLDQQMAGRFLEIGRRGPTIVVLEDLHLADEASLQSLAAILPEVTERAIWFVATRLPLTSLPGPRRALLEAVERAGSAEHIVVRPFNPGEASEFVRTATGLAIPAEELTRWHSQSGGNPSFLELLVQRRTDAPVPRAASPGAAPAEIAEFQRRQVAELPPESERVLAVGAILGREFPFSLLLKASGDDEEKLAELVQELVARGLLRERADESLEFRRDDLRAEIYHNLSEARRRLLHARAVEALEAHGDVDAATVYALARHAFLAKLDDRAVGYNRLAGEFAARSFAPLVARQHFDRARESLRRLKTPDPTAEVEVALDLAVQLDRLGELADAETTVGEALAGPGRSPEVPASLLTVAKVFLARVYADQGRWEDVDRITSQLLAAPVAGTSGRTRLALHRLRGELLYFYGRYPESLEQHDRALELAHQQGDAREVALETARRANVLGMIPGRFEEAVAAYRTAIRSLSEQGDDGEAAYSLIYLGVVLSQHDRLEEGLQVLAEARELAEKAHDPRRLGWSLFNIADLSQELGRVPAAIEANAQAREILGRTGDRFGLVQTLIVEGKIRLRTGELDRAEQELLEGFRVARELNIPADEAEVVLRLAEVALSRGDPPGARSRAAELDRLNIERLRPDLVADHRRFRDRLAGAGGPSAPP